MAETRTVELSVAPDVALQRAHQALTGVKRVKEVQSTSPTSLVGKVGFSMASYGETITVDVAPTAAGSRVTVTSKPTVGFQLVDWGKNRRNIEQVIAALGS